FVPPGRATGNHFAGLDAGGAPYLVRCTSQVVDFLKLRDKQDSDHSLTLLWNESCFYGSEPTPRIPPDPVSGDDAAADASHQAAAAVESRSGGICRGRAGAQPAARTGDGRR